MSDRVWVDGNGEETPISRFMGAEIERMLGAAVSERRCRGCYDSFSGPWCDNCDQWPCICDDAEETP